MQSYRTVFIAVFSLITVSSGKAFTKSSEAANSSTLSDDGLPPPPDPQLFYSLYDGRQNPNMLLDVSRLWDTDVQLQHFQFLHDQINDPKVDNDTKTYARQILSNARERLEETFDTLGVRINYDLMDIIREVRNIQDDQPAICKKLRRLLLQADRKAYDLELEHEQVQKQHQQKGEKSDQMEKQREKMTRKKRRVKITDTEMHPLGKTRK